MMGPSDVVYVEKRRGITLNIVIIYIFLKIIPHKIGIKMLKTMTIKTTNSKIKNAFQSRFDKII